MAFNKDIPTAGTSLRNSNPQILANQSQLQTAINNEHIFSGTSAGTQTGDHTQGSARCFSQAGAPATRIDGNGFLSTDLGSLWVDTDDNAVYILTATTPTWTPVSTEIIATLLAAARVFGDTLGVTGDFAVNTNKFNVTATNGNTTAAGTLEATGLTTVADGSLTKTTAAPSADAEIANKKYVDDQITAITKGYHAGTLTVAGVSVSVANTFEDLDLSGAGGPGANAALVFLRVANTTAAGNGVLLLRPKGETEPASARLVQAQDSSGISSANFETNNDVCYLMCITDSSGVIEITADNAGAVFTFKVIAYIL
jgi:hypothetical protein